MLSSYFNSCELVELYIVFLYCEGMVEFIVAPTELPKWECLSGIGKRILLCGVESSSTCVIECIR